MYSFSFSYVYWLAGLRLDSFPGLLGCCEPFEFFAGNQLVSKCGIGFQQPSCDQPIYRLRRNSQDGCDFLRLEAGSLWEVEVAR